MTWKDVFSLDSVTFLTAEIVNSERPIAFNSVLEIYVKALSEKTITNVVTVASGIRQALEDLSVNS